MSENVHVCVCAVRVVRMRSHQWGRVGVIVGDTPRREADRW